MSTWYKARHGRPEILAAEVERSSESSVWIGGKRSARLSHDWYCYFPTWDEAHAHLIREAEADVQQARLRLDRANGALGNVKGMKRPGPQP